MQFILASTSPYRKQLLENLNLKFIAKAPSVNEEALKKQGPADLMALTQFLAQQKAESLRSEFPNAILIGGDQIAEVNGERLDKPGSAERALAQLRKLRGKSHKLITSIAVVSPLKTIVKTDVTELTLRDMSDHDLSSYLELDKPYDCAGSYKIEKAGLLIMKKIKTQDPSAIQGLPVIALMEALNELGLNLTQLWSPT